MNPIVLELETIFCCFSRFQGYSRKGSALQFLGRFEEAKMTFEEGLKHDENNEQLLKGRSECEDELTGNKYEMFLKYEYYDRYRK